ncbi:MAG: Neutral ceramidase precursor, partial [Labilithrix sp.]|nr:Neutral ceramidase precursor [Labilithrix sp.]
PPPPPSFGLLIGTGVGDITGPAAEVTMMGYANSDQVTTGIHTRLFARAFVFAHPTSGKRVVFVSADLGQLFSSIKQGVIKRLAQKYGGTYDDRNVLLAATHTHAGPGGYSHHAMYNFTSWGFVPESYNVIVEGITNAISQAHDRATTGGLRINQGTLTNISVNRSLPAYNRNPEASTPGLPNTNQEMSLLRIERPSGSAGAIAWFSVHNTSMSRNNRLISSDHKGYASYLFEKSRGTIQPLQRPNDFVAAFPNGDEGDMSPNTLPGFKGPGLDDFGSTQIVGNFEFMLADSLFRQAWDNPGNEVDFRHTFVQMPNLTVMVTPHKNGAGGNTLCPAAYGFSFAAGAEDGPSGMGGFTEGMLFTQQAATGWNNLKNTFSGSAVPQWLRGAFNGVSNTFNDACQRPKPVLVPSGALAWTPDILPFQLFRLGNVAIAGVPAEMTVQAGRRLRERILSYLKTIGVRRVIITGLANEYSGYVTTPEEYDSQQYEGASTLFGRLTLEGYLQTFTQLAEAMVKNQPSPPGPTPPDLGSRQASFQTGVVYDDKRVWEQFGQVMTQPPATVGRSTSITAVFRAGHPKNDLRTGDTYLQVEKSIGNGNWDRVAWDAMPETRFTWKRDTAVDCRACSFAEVRWDVPADTPAGDYRIRHFGSFKHGISGAITEYKGASRTFTIR